MIDAHAAQLSEHFGAIQIMATYPCEVGTQAVFGGRGDFYARQGLAHAFIQTEQAVEIAHAIHNEN